jgi:hypothetical protein
MRGGKAERMDDNKQMSAIRSAKGAAEPTIHAKHLIAEFMYAKGKSFLGAALLLRNEGGDKYVTLHLLCQSIEIILKALLLAKDYDAHIIHLRTTYGHNLIKLADVAIAAYFRRPIAQNVRIELSTLNQLYSDHRLRYGTGYDVFVDPNTIPHMLVLRRIGLLIKFLERDKKIFTGVHV